MARPRSATPNYRLVLRGDRYYARWWQNGQWQRLSTGTAEEREARRWLAQFIAGQGTPLPPDAPLIAAILDAYLEDRRGRVASIGTLEACAKALKRHLGDLEPDHLTKERSRFYARARRTEGHMVGPASQKRKKPTSDGTVIRELVTLRAALRWAVEEKWITSEPSIEVPSAPPPRERYLHP